MSEIDPHKILAQFEAARRLQRQESAEGFSLGGQHRTLLVGTIAIAVLAALALWALFIVLDQLPRPIPKKPQPGLSVTP